MRMLLSSQCSADQCRLCQLICFHTSKIKIENQTIDAVPGYEVKYFVEWIRTDRRQPCFCR